MIDAFFLRDGTPTALLLQGSYRYELVLLSVAVAILSSLMSLQVAGMARRAQGGLLRHTALLTGSFALGCGIWSMHFIGMLAFELCTTVNYDHLTTLLSMLPAVFASWVSLNMLSHTSINRRKLIISGVLVGAGIGAMHYSGMAAMQMSAQLRYDPLWFATSIVVAVLLAILALWIRYGLQRRGRLKSGQALLLSATVMGFAIAGMHYTGMAAARFVGVAQASEDILRGDNVYLALAISLFTITAGVFVLAGNALLRYRQLLQKMQEDQSRLSAIVNTAVDSIITIDQNGIIQAVNQATGPMFGWRSEELIGQNIKLLMPDPYRSQHDDYLHRYQTTGEQQVIGKSREVVAMRKDGTVFPIRLAIGRAEGSDSPLFVGFVTDISERTQMERELQARETQYRTLIANIPGVAFRSRVDENWSKLFISQAFTQLTGWDREQLLGGQLSMISIIHPDDLAHVRETVASALREHRSYVVEYRILHRDGGERWVSESAGGVYDVDDQPQWIDGVIIDITDSKRTAAEYEGTVSAIRRAMAQVIFDLQGHILDANEHFLQLSGYTLDELRGQHHSLLCQPGERDLPAYQQFWQALRRGEFQSGEFCRRDKQGRDLWIQASYNPILDADGKPWKIVKLASDLSERKQMEQALIAARDHAEQASAAKGMFLANMSHEIRTPMNAIIGFTELLLGSTLDSTQRRHLDTVRQSARSLLGLLNDILDTAKLERGAIELEPADFDCHELCQQLLQTFALQADNKQLTLQLDYATDCPHWLHGDALRLRQILTNLLGNALKFTREGGVVLKVGRKDGQLMISVQDSGIGIAADRLEHIFAPFTQADASMARRFGGTGLGTTISRQLAELMGGEISVSSTLGAGSCFTVTLPLPLAHQPATVADTRHMAMNLPPLQILAVDDVPENLELLQLALQRLGHRVDTMNDAANAVQHFASQPYDLILMDVQMPGMDGLEATRRIRALEQQQQRLATPVIALTASVLSQDRDNAHAAGMNGFATKPIDLPALLQEMARVTGKASDNTGPHSAAANRQDIDWAGASDRWGSEARLLKQLQRFVDEQAYSATALLAADSTERSQLAHRLRGLCGNLGLDALATLATQAELGAPLDSDWQDRWQQAFTTLAQQLAQRQSGQEASTQAASQPPADPEQTRALLQALAESCRHGEFNETALAGLQALLPARAWQTLQQQLDEFDFDAASQTISTLLADIAATGNRN